MKKSIEKLVTKIMKLGEDSKYDGEPEKFKAKQVGIKLVEKFLDKEFGEFVGMGVGYDGEHHKQWCLYQIAKKMGFNLEDCEEGIAP